MGKVTQVKIGHFIGFYKRSPNKSVLPYDVTDPFDFLIVSTFRAHHFGQFIFPKSIPGKRPERKNGLSSLPTMGYC